MSTASRTLSIALALALPAAAATTGTVAGAGEDPQSVVKDGEHGTVPTTTRSVAPEPLVTVSSNPPDTVVGDYRIDFNALDQDGDQRLGRTEVASNATLTAEFDAVDRDRDGWLDSNEVHGWKR